MRWLLLLLLSLPLAGGFVDAQTPEEDQTALDAARAKLTQANEDQTEAGEAWRAAHQERIKLLEELLATGRRRATLPVSDDLDTQSVELDTQLAEARESETPTAITLANPEELGPFEQAAKAAEAEQVSAEAKLEALRNRRSDAEAELAGLSDRGARASQRVESLTGDDDLSRYKVETARLESRVISQRATFLTAGLGVWGLQETVLGKQLELATAAAQHARGIAELAAVEASRLREAEAKAARREAELETRRAERERDPIERFRLRARAEAGNLRATNKSFQTILLDLTEREIRAREARRDLEAERNTVDERLRLRPRGVETLLRRHLDRARRAKRIIADNTLPELDAETEVVQLELADVLDRLWNIQLPSGENEDLATLLAEVSPARQQEAAAAFENSLDEDGLVAALRERSQQLEKAAGLHARILQAVDERHAALTEFEDFILARMLWTRSDVPIDGRALSKAWGELRSLPGPYRKDRTWSRLRENLGSRFPILIVAIAAIAALRYLTRRVSGWRDVGASRAPWRRHGLRIAAGLLWAIGPPMQFWVAAWAIFALGGPDAFDPPVTTLLIYQAYFLLARRSTRVLLGKQGLLVGPQGLPQPVGIQLARNIAILTLAGQAFYAPYLVLVGSPFQFEILPRILFTAWSFGVALAVLGLVRRNGALVQAWTVKGGLLRPIIRFLAVFSAVALIPIFALDVLGYRVGAQRSMGNGLKIFIALFILGGVFRVVERIGAYWVDRADKAEDEEDARLLRARGLGIRAFVRIGAYVIVVLSALLLKETFGIGGVLTKLLATAKILEIGPERWLTMWDVTVAVMWVAAGHIIASNLRMLHESLVTPFAGTTDEGNQFAFLAILRYALLTVAYGGALVNLGFSFETLGWFATAASVGLGFGLQEIVANFISGLILLFERPIRVGDIVTIGATSGKIDSISMRATVITNWERQTIIVPNKKFITEDLTNWTRTDKVMRRDLTVRVAYGTEVETVIRLLMEVVKGHPAVLSDPAPRILFESFGVVGIEFKVLFYTTIDQGLGTRSEIHALISARFAVEGIEIPFVRHHDEMLGGAEQPPT